MDLLFEILPYAIVVIILIPIFFVGYRILSKKFDREKISALNEAKYWRERYEKEAIECKASIESANLLADDRIDQTLLEKKAEIEAIIRHADEIIDNAEKKIEARLKSADERFRLAKESLQCLLEEVHHNLIINITSSNLAVSRKKLDSIIEFASNHGLEVLEPARKVLQNELQEAFEKVVRKEAARQEQARIKAQIREEERLEAERQHELQHLQSQETAIELALEKALKKAKDEHTEEVARLEAQLAEAREKLARAVSQAQLTRAGFVYIISNIGSFGTDVYKIGMTRRLTPMDRVRELGDASVPFPFDVHMMISCEDAPTLENALHKEFDMLRLNKVNLRKEFFKVTLDKIRVIVEKNHGSVDYVAEPEALQYRETIAMSDEDYRLRSKLIPQTEEIE
ncbi:MAG: GIY-YIG nuclease family protein [Candidatus Sumerlaeota bacterium]|nr:GIY-YIG nuclease family protein [Candidatus Sumerlaeota bacterium]